MHVSRNGPGDDKFTFLELAALWGRYVNSEGGVFNENQEP